MGRTCTICVHPARATIDAALETDRSLRDIAAQFGVSKTALHRHWQTHVSGQAPQPPSSIKTRMPTRQGPRFWAFAKWGLVVGIGMFVWYRANARPLSPPSGERPGPPPWG
jgi:hypothetical protein